MSDRDLRKLALEIGLQIVQEERLKQEMEKTTDHLEKIRGRQRELRRIIAKQVEDL